MKDPVFLLQKGNIMQTEKFACMMTDYPSQHLSYEDLTTIEAEVFKLSRVPVGSVEFTRKYAEIVGVFLPESLFFFDVLQPFYLRNIRQGLFSDAQMSEFVKPESRVKLFTGDFKSELAQDIPANTKVLISEPVVFESEFRFYIQDFVNGPKIVGWTRYDDFPITNPDPDQKFVREIAQTLHDIIGPNAYSIDIGWRPDLGRYSLVEVNDGWSLGYYDNRDSQSKPPTRYDYATMLVTRWTQILFCSL